MKRTLVEWKQRLDCKSTCVGQPCRVVFETDHVSTSAHIPEQPADARGNCHERCIVEIDLDPVHPYSLTGVVDAFLEVRRRGCLSSLSCNSRPSSSCAASLSMSCAKPSTCNTRTTVARLVLGSPDSSFRSVGKVTPTRSANTAWVNFRRSLAARSRSPSAASWPRWRGCVGGVTLGMKNIITFYRAKSNYIFYFDEF